MKELKHNLINAFKDPATGQDYLNRILKGNTDWLTSGRNAAKVGAIQRIEQITGKQVLQPALKEMAAAYMKNPDAMGLPSFGLKSIITSLIPNKLFIKGGSGNLVDTVPQIRKMSGSDQEQNQNTDNLPFVFGLHDSENQQSNPQPNQESKPMFNKGKPSGVPPKAAALPPQKKYLNDEKVAMDYYQKANKDKHLARQMAQQDGWTVV